MTRRGAVIVAYLEVAQRWEISWEGNPGTTVLTEVQPGIWIGKGASGDIAEVVIDIPTIPAIGTDLIRMAFGSQVADALSQMHTDGDLDVIIQVPSTTVDTYREPEAWSAIDGEPGIPSRKEDSPDLASSDLASSVNAYSVKGVGSFSGPVELQIRNGSLLVQLPGTTQTEGLWVRISSAQTGSLLGLGPIRGGSADVTMNLDVTAEQLHVEITPTPLAPVGDQVQRRRRWAEDLLATEALENARIAVQIADQIGDTALAARALRLLTNSRPPLRWWKLAGLLALLAATLVAIGFLVAGALTSDIPPSSPGPITATYRDDTVVRAFIPDRLPIVKPGDELQLKVSAQTIDFLGYGYDPASTPAGQEEAASREGCRSTLNRPGSNEQGMFLTERPFTVHLTAVNGADSFISSSGQLSDQVVRFSSVAEACDSATYESDGAFLVPSVIQRGETTVQLRIPMDLPAGLWRVEIHAPDQPATVEGSMVLEVVSP